MGITRDFDLREEQRQATEGFNQRSNIIRYLHSRAHSGCGLENILERGR